MDAETERATDDVEREPVFHKLDPLAVRVWGLEAIFTVGFAFVASLITLGVLWILGLIAWWIGPLVWTAVWILLYLTAVWHPPKRYAAWSYRLSEQVLELRYGRFLQTSVMIPLTRMQHVDLKRGPLDRRFGLATVQVHTAGTSHASHEIPNLTHDVGVRLREQLIDAAELQTTPREVAADPTDE